MSCLEVYNFSVYHRTREVVKDVSFSIEYGQLVALLGLNGSGKTTLMKGICSLLKSKGQCTIDGLSVEKMTNKEKGNMISYIPQRSGLNFPISVLDVVLMGFASTMSIFEQYSDAHKKNAVKALDIVEMSEKRNDDFMTLSEGQKQLVILARALAQDTKIMIFDEPDSAMDFNNRHMILSKIRQNINSNKSGILCLHDANFALAYCDRALIVKEGSLVYDLDINNADDLEIELALSKIYGDIKIVTIDHAKIMLRA